MLLTLLVAVAALGGVLAILFGVGRHRINSAISENEKAGVLVKEFHQDLVQFANSHGQDQGAYTRLSFKSSSVEKALGYDNYVSGVRIGHYQLQGAPLLPLAIQEMRRQLGDYLWNKDGLAAADIVQTTLYRHLGRRQQIAESLAQEANSFRSCVAWGWSLVAAIPIAILESFGLLTPNGGRAVRQSLLFRLWSLLLALAAFAGPVIGYLADRDKVDATINALWK